MATFTEKVCNPDLEKGQNQDIKKKKKPIRRLTNNRPSLKETENTCLKYQ